MHPNTIRAWSDAGRLRYYRINPRGDRRYRLGDLQRFLAAAETGAVEGARRVPARHLGRPAHGGSGRGGAVRGRAQAASADLERADPLDAERHHLDLSVASAVIRTVNTLDETEEALETTVRTVRDAYGHHLVAIWQARGDRLVPVAVASADVAGPFRLVDVPAQFGVLGRALGDGRRSGADRTDAAAGPPPRRTRWRRGGGPARRPARARGGDPRRSRAWGALLIVGETPGSLGAA